MAIEMASRILNLPHTLGLTELRLKNHLSLCHYWHREGRVERNYGLNMSLNIKASKEATAS